jgi:hypothetical protein
MFDNGHILQRYIWYNIEKNNFRWKNKIHIH